MYRHLLGDCFLVRVAGEDGRTSHILIDCGLLQGVQPLPGVDGKTYMTKVAQDIAETTGGKIDLLVITHEHWDHIGGFSQAKDILLDPERMEYRAIWMAWTEDPGDPDAKRLRDGIESRKMALARFPLAFGLNADADAAGTAADQSQAPDSKKLLNLKALTEDLYNFIGPLELDPNAFGVTPKGRLTGARIMEALKSRGPVTFLSPGKTHQTPGPVSLPVAVLGPPRATSRLFKDLPSRGENKETYFGEEFLAFSLIGAAANGDPGKIDTNTPFPPRVAGPICAPDEDDLQSWAEATGTTREWLFNRYFAEEDDTGTNQRHRQIDSDWTLAASSLALKLDSDTNNTSLVLAFRLPDDTFLLFAADAQVGNWLSWHDQTYLFDGDEKTLTAGDILAQTRLYKVGHHGSHNATLRAKGLELMTHPDLVAMVSTIEEVAKEQGTRGWKMPDPDVKAALLNRCNGRVIRGDMKWADDPDVAELKPKSDLKQFRQRLDESSDLYVELTVWSGDAPARRQRKGHLAAKGMKMDNLFSIDNASQFLKQVALPAAPSTFGLEEPKIDFEQAKQQALLVGSDVLSFDSGVEAEFREAVSDTALIAQLAATKQLGQNPDPIAYFDAYFSIVGNLGWATQIRDTAEYRLTTDGAQVHEAIISVVTAFLGNAPGAVALVELTLNSLKKMDQGSPFITLFQRNSQNAQLGRFQFTTVRQDPTGGLLAEVMAFALEAEDKITQVLFFKLRQGKSRMRRSLGSMSLNRTAMTALLPALRAKVAGHLAGNLAQLEI
jgi:hypothetical protein